jgi:predicted HTH transcriptional regulator
MPLENPQLITLWTEDDLLDIPTGETDDYEYKSSLIRESSHYRSELQSKIVKTASAFWNTGGGILVVGVDDRGHIDGGIPPKMGKQRLREWIDTVLTTVTPVGPYEVRTISCSRHDSKIEEGCVVLVVAFGESFDLPHMAPDNRYYVRAGAHSNPANHYLVSMGRAFVVLGIAARKPTESGGLSWSWSR